MTKLRNRWATLLLTVLVCTVLGVPSLNAQGLEESTTIIFVRHAEAGDGDDPDLLDIGRDRAVELVHVLEGVQIDAIHSTPLNRTLQTAGPTAEQHGLEIITTDPTRTFAEDMAAKLRADHSGQTVLVVGHSNTTPAIINALGGGPYEQLDHEEYDSVFVVTLLGDQTRVIRMQYGVGTP